MNMLMEMTYKALHKYGIQTKGTALWIWFKENNLLLRTKYGSIV